MGCYGYGWGWGGFHPGGFVMGFGFLILLMVGFTLMLKGMRFHHGYGYGQACGHGGYLGGDDSALEIAARRYAKGEINQAEYQQLKQDLQK